MNHQTTIHRPTARCKAYAALLPILDEPGVDSTASAEARAHLATCAYCQEQQAAYRQLETAAHQHLSPPSIPRYQTEEIMRDLLGEPVAAPGEQEPAANTRSPRKPRSPRRFIASLAPLAAVLVIVLIAVTLFANHPHTAGGGNNTFHPPTSWSKLTDISMVSATEGWAAGLTGPCTANQCQATSPLLLHLHGGTWSQVRLSFKGQFNTISMISTSDGWIGGYELILHYDGHIWKQMPNPQHLTPFQMQMFSDTDGWAIMSDTNNIEALMHYDGHTWTAAPLPASLGITKQRDILFNDLTMISPTEGWVVGTIYDLSLASTNISEQTTVILHYANSQWTIQDTIKGASLQSISISSATDGWAVGFTEIDTQMVVNGTPQTSNGKPVVTTDQHPLLLHYAQGKWTRVTSAIDREEGDAWLVSMTSATDGWMVGPQANSLLHYNGQQWLAVPLPAGNKTEFEISRLLMLSATNGWAVGDARTTIFPPGTTFQPGTEPQFFESITPLILHYQNGRWSVVPN